MGFFIVEKGYEFFEEGELFDLFFCVYVFDCGLGIVDLFLGGDLLVVEVVVVVEVF